MVQLNLGLFEGKPLSLEWKPRASTEGKVDSGRLTLGKRSVPLDCTILSPKLVRLMPPAYCRAELEDWAPFLAACILAGAL
jgi:hypothetical protein